MPTPARGGTVLQPHPDARFAGVPPSPPPSRADGLHTSGPQIRRPACSSHDAWQTAVTHEATALTWS